MKLPGMLVYISHSAHMISHDTRVGILIRPQLTRKTTMIMPLPGDDTMSAWDVFVDGQIEFHEANDIHTEEEFKAMKDIFKKLFENPEMIKRWNR